MLPKHYRQHYDVLNKRPAHLPNATFIFFAVCFSFLERLLLYKPLTLAIPFSVFPVAGLHCAQVYCCLLLVMPE